MTRYLATAILSALLAAGGAWQWQANKYERQIADTSRDLAQQSLRALEVAHADTQRLQAQADAAAAASAARYRALAVDRDRLRRAVDGLRDEQATATAGMPTATCDSARAYAATARAVFGECAAALERLAGQADGHAIDATRFDKVTP